MTSRKCPLCGKPGLQHRKKAIRVTLEDGTVESLEAAPHDFCPHCGEGFYAAGAVPLQKRSKQRLKKAI